MITTPRFPRMKISTARPWRGLFLCRHARQGEGGDQVVCDMTQRADKLRLSGGLTWSEAGPQGDRQAAPAVMRGRPRRSRRALRW